MIGTQNLHGLGKREGKGEEGFSFHLEREPECCWWTAFRTTSMSSKLRLARGSQSAGRRGRGQTGDNLFTPRLPLDGVEQIGRREILRPHHSQTPSEIMYSGTSLCTSFVRCAVCMYAWSASLLQAVPPPPNAGAGTTQTEGRPLAPRTHWRHCRLCVDVCDFSMCPTTGICSVWPLTVGCSLLSIYPSCGCVPSRQAPSGRGRFHRISHG